MGPIAVPSNGMKVDIAKEWPLSSGLQQSARTGFVTYVREYKGYKAIPSLQYHTANSTLAPIPDKKRAAIMVALF